MVASTAPTAVRKAAPARGPSFGDRGALVVPAVRWRLVASISYGKDGRPDTVLTGCGDCTGIGRIAGICRGGESGGLGDADARAGPLGSDRVW